MTTSSDQFDGAFDTGKRLPPSMLTQPPAERHRGEGTYWNAGDKGFSTAGGFYEHEEFQSLANMAKRPGGFRSELGYEPEEEADAMARFSPPLQGALFGPNVGVSDPDARQRAVESHQVETRKVAVPDAEVRLHQHVNESKMPDRLVGALHGKTVVEHQPGNRGGAYYGTADQRPQRYSGAPSEPGYDAGDITTSPSMAPSTTIHELGHRADYRVAQKEGTGDSPDIMSRMHRGADPRLEGIADAFVDRYGSQQFDDFRHFQNPMHGYGINHWKTESNSKAEGLQNAAVYAATRAHFGATGEVIPPGPGTGGSMRKAAYLDRLVTTSPHAVKALRQTGLKAEGAKAVETYRNTRFVGFQHELPLPGNEDSWAGKSLYDVPETHGKLGDQFGRY